MKLLTHQLAIDLGSTNTRVHAGERGVVVDAPSVIAVRLDEDNKQRIFAVGEEALDMMGKTPDCIRVVRPIRDGVIVNIDAACAMLKHFIRGTCKAGRLHRLSVLVCVPAGITEIEKRAVVEATKSAGACRTDLIEGTVAAALGADLPVAEPVCNMVVDIGGGTTDAAVISLAGLVTGRSVKVAGDSLDSSIQRYIQRQYNLLVGPRTAGLIKTTLGDACPDPDRPAKLDVKGRDLSSGIPKILRMDSGEIFTAMNEPLSEILRTVRAVLEEVPPELAADVIERGILLTGGGALLQNVDEMLQREIGLPVSVAQAPLATAVMGAARVLAGSNGLSGFILR